MALDDINNANPLPQGPSHSDLSYSSPLIEILRTPTVQVYEKALHTFEEPQCPSENQDCYVVSYPDALKGIISKPRHTSLTQWREWDKVQQLGEGLRWLLASLEYFKWGQASEAPLNPLIVENLTSNYFKQVAKELAKADVGGAINGQLAFIANSLKTGQFHTASEVERELRGIILGYLNYVYHAIEPRLPEIALQTLPLEPPPSEKPASEEKPIEPPSESKPPDTSKKRRRRRTRPSNPSQEGRDEEIPLSRKGESLKRVAEATEGKLKRISPGDDIVEIVEEVIREGLKEKNARDVQIELLIDGSGSMQDEIENLMGGVDRVIKSAQKELRDGGQISIGVRVYVETTTPLGYAPN